MEIVGTILYSAAFDVLVAFGVWVFFKFNPAALGTFHFMVRKALGLNENIDRLWQVIRENNDGINNMLDGVDSRIKESHVEFHILLTGINSRVSDIENIVAHLENDAVHNLSYRVEELASTVINDTPRDSRVKNVEDLFDGLNVDLLVVENKVLTLEQKQKEIVTGTEAVVSAIRSLEDSLYRRLGPTPQVKPAKVLKVVKSVKGKKK